MELCIRKSVISNSSDSAFLQIIAMQGQGGIRSITVLGEWSARSTARESEWSVAVVSGQYCKL